MATKDADKVNINLKKSGKNTEVFIGDTRSDEKPGTSNQSKDILKKLELWCSGNASLSHIVK